jgi:hypothetical protein
VVWQSLIDRSELGLVFEAHGDKPCQLMRTASIEREPFSPGSVQKSD